MLQIIKNQIRLTRGDTGIFNVHVTDTAGEPYELQEGDEIRFTVRKTPTSGDIFIQKSGPEIILNPEDTARMQFGKYSYDVELTREDGTVDTVIPPTSFELLQEVTY